MPEGPAWHQNLITSAVDKNIISDELANEIKEYMSFRHFVVHGYAFNLNPERLQGFADNILKVFEKFKSEINKLFI